MKLEICANSYQSAKNAQIAGAHRIELCSELAVGGITPSYGLLKKVMHELSIDTFVLIRPRSGNFNYSDAEFEIMKNNIQLCKEMGCKGIVSGVLNKDNTIDKMRTKELVSLSRPLSFTFHRGFDWVPNINNGLSDLIDLGVDRILTSGQHASAKEGIDQLVSLKEKAQNKLIILPGGGVSATNSVIFKKAGFAEIHASLTTMVTANTPPPISMNSNKHFNETSLGFSDIDKIKELLKNIQ